MSFSKHVRRPEQVINSSRVDTLHVMSLLPRSKPYEFSLGLFKHGDLENLPRINNPQDSTDYGSLHDLRLGTFDGQPCTTCGNIGDLCEGHPGFIEFPIKIPNPVFTDVIEKILNRTCYNCGSIVGKYKTHSKLSATDNDPRYILSTIEAPKTTTEKTPACPKCKEVVMVYVREKLSARGLSNFTGKFKRKSASEPQSEEPRVISFTELESHLNNIPNSVVEELGLAYHPKYMMMAGQIVTPNQHRLRNTIDNKTHNHPMTGIYIDIINRVNSYALAEDDYSRYTAAADIWQKIYNIQLRVEEGKEPSSVKMIINKKQGIFRRNMMSKTTEYSARFVIGVDPSLPNGVVGFPREHRSTLTKPIVVNPHNIEICRQLILKGEVRTIIWANHRTDDILKIIKTLNPEQKLQRLSSIAQQLEFGAVVNRYLVDGDIVLVNRAPTMHDKSIQPLRVKLTDNPGLTINMPVTEAFNADFDGDEMQLYVLQMIEAEAEARYLMSGPQCMFDTLDSTPAVGIIYDALSSIYILTRDNNYIEGRLFGNLLFNLSGHLVSATGKIINSEIPTPYEILEMMNRYHRKGISPIPTYKSDSPRSDIVDYLYLKFGKTSSKEFGAPTIRELAERIKGEFILHLMDSIQEQELHENNDMWKLQEITETYIQEQIDVIGNMINISELTDDSDLLYKYLRSVLVNPLTHTKILGRVLVSLVLPKRFDYKWKGLAIRDNVIFGQINKKHVGSSQYSIIHNIYKLYDEDETSRFITQIYWVLDQYMSYHGLSVGITDCYPDKFHRPGYATGYILLRLMKDLEKADLDTMFADSREVDVEQINDKVNNFIRDVVDRSIEAAPTHAIDLPRSKRRVYIMAIEEYIRFIQNELNVRRDLYKVYTLLKGGIHPNDVLSYIDRPSINHKDVNRFIESFKHGIDEDVELENLTEIPLNFEIEYRNIIDILTDMLDYRKIYDEMIDQAQRDIDERVKELDAAEIDPKTREDMKETYIKNKLNNIRMTIESDIAKKIASDNPLSIMINSGAKGSATNLVQMSGILGQQYSEGSRISQNEFGRCTPYFGKDTSLADILARGFCNNNLVEGANLAQYLILQWGARDGLIKQALSTGKVGHSGRNMREAHRDIKVDVGGAVTNSKGYIVQFSYYDGTNPLYLMKKGNNKVATNLQSLAYQVSRKYT